MERGLSLYQYFNTGSYHFLLVGKLKYLRPFTVLFLVLVKLKAVRIKHGYHANNGIPKLVHTDKISVCELGLPTPHGLREQNLNK